MANHFINCILTRKLAKQSSQLSELQNKIKSFWMYKFFSSRDVLHFFEEKNNLDVAQSTSRNHMCISERLSKQSFINHSTSCQARRVLVLIKKVGMWHCYRTCRSSLASFLLWHWSTWMDTMAFKTRKRDVSADSDPHYHMSILVRTFSFCEHQINFVQSVC